MKIIAIEEHFWTEDYRDYLRSRKDYPRIETVEDTNHNKVERLMSSPSLAQGINPKIFDMGTGRLAEMDEAGIDMQVVSLSIPGVEAFDADDGIKWAKSTNDELARLIKQNPTRFAGMAAIGPQDPPRAAEELERAVKELGFKGAVINSHIRGEYLDDKKYWPIFEKAEKLNVPIYLHPREPSPDIIKPYLDYPGLYAAMWGFAVETSLHAMRLLCSGVFDEYPRLKIILGHLGEGIPFWLSRIDSHWRGVQMSRNLKRTAREYIRDNLLVSTSGMFEQPSFIGTYLQLGADNILFSIDYPYEAMGPAAKFMESVPISDHDKEKISHLNAEELLGL